MLELFVYYFLMTSAFTTGILSGLPINKSDPIIIKRVAIVSIPAPVKSVQDPELRKLEMEVLSLEKQLKDLMAKEEENLIVTSIRPLAMTLALAQSSPDAPIKSGDKIGVKSRSTPKPTLKPISTTTPKPTNTFTPNNSGSTPTPTPFPTSIISGQVPTITKQAAPANGLNANELFTMVNNYRTSFGLPAFKKDEAVCAIAQNRAPEVYDEIYGTSVMHSGLRAMNLPYWVNENIINFTTEQQAFNWWINDKIHRDAILADYNYSCIACHAYSCSEIFTSYIPK